MTFMKLTPEEFEEAIKELNLEDRSIKIARMVLVDGLTQSDVHKEMKLTRGAVSQTIKKVVSAHKILKQGGEFVSVVLPKHQAFIVRGWAKQFAAQTKGECYENASNSKPKGRSR